MNAAFPPALLSRVEDACINASAPPTQRWIDGWLVRTLPGKARRARAVHALMPGVLPLQERLAAAEAACRQGGVPLIFRITPFTRPAELPAQLQAQGFKAVDETLVMIAPRLPTTTSRPLPDDLVLANLDGPAFAEAVGELRGSPAEHRRTHALRLAHSPTPYEGWVLRQRDSGAVQACGQVATEGDLAGLYDIVTAPTARNRGLATLLCEHLLLQSALTGATTGYLQVDADNPPALAIYRRLGFAEAYRYHYLERPEA
jgi:ribosomal protein S18 acetylase RimI-like enzyme